MSNEAEEKAALAQLEAMDATVQDAAAAADNELTAEDIATLAQLEATAATAAAPEPTASDIAALAQLPSEAPPVEVTGTAAEEADAAANAALASLAAEEDAADKQQPPTLPAAEAAEEAPETVMIDPFALGNEVSITDGVYGVTIGLVIYRDNTLIRVLPRGVSDRAVDFPLVSNGAAFDPELNVISSTYLSVASSNYFVDIMGFKDGDHLEFFTTDGQEARPPGDIVKVNRKKDSIVLTDGTVLKFRRIGPEKSTGIAVIRIVSGPGEDAEEAEGSAAPAAVRTQADIFALLRTIVHVAAPEVSTVGRGYPDSIQREDLFQDLLARLSTKQKTNPRRIRQIEREVDLAMALKNTSVHRTEAGSIVGPEQTEFNTLADVVKKTKTPLPSFIPVVDAALVLNLDVLEPEGGMAPDYKHEQVAPRVLGEIENASDKVAEAYLAAGPKEKGFAAYIYDLMGRDAVTLQANGAGTAPWLQDQDILRTDWLETPVNALYIDPASYKPEKTVISLANVTSNTESRYMRVLTEDYHYRPGFGRTDMIAPVDPYKVKGYTTLPTKAALALRPPKRPGHLPTALLYSATLQDDNLPTVASAIAELSVVGQQQGNPLQAMALDASTGLDLNLADWLRGVLEFAIHPVDSLGPRGPLLLAVLDTLGIGETDLSEEVYGILRTWVRKSQRQWWDLMTAERERVRAFLDAEAARTFQTVTGDTKATWDVIRAADSLKDILSDISRRDPAIAEAPTVLTASLLREAQGDAAPLVWIALAAYDNRELTIDAATAAASLSASRAYALQRKAIRDANLLKLSGAPEVNTCPHVNELEAIRNLNDVPQRARVLRDFIEEYQGGRKGDWVTCRICREECVCYHEIMELEALAQPRRMDSILKEMVVRFGGERYEGKIICKNCGQGLQDIDYDDSVEFDDEGRAIVTHSVLTEEQLDDIPMESAWKEASSFAVQPAIQWQNSLQNDLAAIMEMIAERGRLQIPDEVKRAIVTRAEKFVQRFTPASQKAYDDLVKNPVVQKQLAKEGHLGKTYAQYLEIYTVPAVMAVTALALQSANPPILVTHPLEMCPFSRSGWPLVADAEPKAIERSALYYIACVVASIEKTAGFHPWDRVPWIVNPDLAGRVTTVRDIIVDAVKTILGGNKKVPGGLPFRGDVEAEMDFIRKNPVAQEAQRKVTYAKDQMPVGFKPEPFPPEMIRPVLESLPTLTNVATAVADGNNVEPKVAPIAAALTKQAIAVVDELHSAAKKAVLPPLDTKDSVCCMVSLRDAEAGALLGEKENPMLLDTGAVLRRALPTVPTAGTHLWTAFSVPRPVPVEQKIDPTVLYKLFLKYCYVGPQPGAPHEFTTGNVCRQCGLRLGKPLDLIDFTVEGADILAAQAGSLKPNVTEDSFNQLSANIRLRKQLKAQVAVTVPAWHTGLGLVMDMANALTYIPDGQGMKQVTAALRASLAAVLAMDPATLSGRDGKLIRAEAWSAVTRLMDALRKDVVVAVGDRYGTTVMKVLSDMTEDPFVEGPRAVQEYWCAKTEAAAEGHRVVSVEGAKWKGISSAHDEVITKLLTENANWYAGDLTAKASAVLHNVGLSLGPMMRAWQRFVRPDTTLGDDGPWTVKEAQTLLRCFVYQAWHDALMASSWMYVTVPVEDQMAVAASLAKWTTGLMLHVKQQFIRFSKEEVRQLLQRRAELERTSIVDEFTALEGDPDMKRVFSIQKQLRIGRWGQGANIQKLDADLFEAESQQRLAMRIIAPPVQPIDVTGTQQAPGTVVFGALQEDGGEEGVDLDYAADGDNY